MDEESGLLDKGTVVAGVNGSFFNMSLSNSDPLGITFEEGYTYANQGYNTMGNGVASMIQKLSGEVMFDFSVFP